MASEIRVDKINSLSGVGTVTLSPTGVDIAGITTAATLRATTGIVTSLTAGPLVTSSGKVGINTDNPTQELTVDSSAFTNVVVKSSRTTATDQIGGYSFFNHAGVSTATINGLVNGSMLFKTTGVERLRIEDDGKVGIATTNGTTYQLLTLSSDSAVARFERTGGAWAKVDIRAGTTAGNSYITFSDSATSELGAINYEHGDETLRFETWNGSSRVERLRLESDGDVTITDGDLIIGTSGHGIDFSATGDGNGTMSSELLDDYEEGSWTPVISFGGGSTGITYTARDGEYTKIGRQVTLTFMVELSDKGSSTGDATVTGLPFTVPDLISNTVIESSGSAGYWNNIDPDLMFMAFTCETVGGGQLSMRFQPETGASDAVDSLSNSQFTDTTNFRGSITYFTS